MTRAAVRRRRLSSEFHPGCHVNSVPSVVAIPEAVRGVPQVLPYYTYSPQRYADSPVVALVAGVYNTIDMRRPPHPPKDPKLTALRAAGGLHPHPDAVQDPTFHAHAFFDRRDWVQVRYEMLRRHRVDGRPVTEVARAFGVSRQAVYQTEATFVARGLPGLLPRKRGPKTAHKATAAILDFVAAQRATGAPRGALEAAAVARHFGVTLHPRSLDRALARREKKRQRQRPPR